MSKKQKVLIVEDEVIVAEDLKSILSQAGYEVVAHVYNADSAVELASKHLPDAILMDIVLKGEKSGIDASRVIKGKLDIPVIFCSAFSDENIRERAELTEPFGYIVKPFQDRQVVTTLQMALYKGRMDRILKEKNIELERLTHDLESAKLAYEKLAEEHARELEKRNRAQ